MIYWICHLVCDANVGTLRLMSGEIVGILERRSVDIFCVQVSRYMGSVLNSVGIVPSWDSWVLCHLAIFLSWVQMGIIFFLWVFCGSEIFSRGYFMGPKVFLLGTLWIRIIFLWVLRGSKIFSCRYTWVRNFFLWVFRWHLPYLNREWFRQFFCVGLVLFHLQCTKSLSKSNFIYLFIFLNKFYFVFKYLHFKKIKLT